MARRVFLGTPGPVCHHSKVELTRQDEEDRGINRSCFVLHLQSLSFNAKIQSAANSRVVRSAMFRNTGPLPVSNFIISVSVSVVEMAT